ncbi:MAG: hypothetical protein JWL59_3783 [Chthoniobacteraceae bacterium]|nr:hypothetical protein [Chthoniobacteraceae bacterium]
MNKHHFLVSSIVTLCALGIGAALHAAPVFTTDGPGGEGITTDIFDILQGNQVIFSTPQHNGAGESDPRSAFGGISGFVETNHSLFSDGPGAGTVDFIEWQTPGWINLSSIDLHLQQDGAGNAVRGASSYALFASQDGVNFSAVSSGTIPSDVNGANANIPLLIHDDALTGTTNAVRAFRLEVTRLTNQGVRVLELDASGSAAVPVAATYLDRLAFNYALNTLTGRGAAQSDDQGPGLITAGGASPGIGSDSPIDAVGNNNGAIEPEDYIFADGGAVDNGNAVFGDEGEAVDFIEWHTSSPVRLAGFKLGLSGDGTDPNRDTEMVRFLIEGVEVDLFDNNGFDGDVSRLFAGGAVTGDDFRIEFTRTTQSGGRIFEIDAIVAAVPEPSALVALLSGAGLLALRRPRR